MKTPLQELIELWMNQKPEDENESNVIIDWYEFTGELSELLEKEKQVIIDAWKSASHLIDGDPVLKTKSEEYYKETFEMNKESSLKKQQEPLH